MGRCMTSISMANADHMSNYSRDFVDGACVGNEGNEPAGVGRSYDQPRHRGINFLRLWYSTFLGGKPHSKEPSMVLVAN